MKNRTVKNHLAILYCPILIGSLIFTTTNASATGLVSHWKFDDGLGSSIAKDSAGNNDCTLVGNPVWTTLGKINGALRFDGDDYVDCGSDKSIEPTPNITVMAWVYPATSIESTQIIIASSVAKCGYGLGAGWPGYARRFAFWLYLRGEDQFGVWMDWETSGYSDTIITGESWYHVAATYDGYKIILYINGQEEKSSTVQANEILYKSDGNRVIGKTQNFEFFNGLIDEVRIWNRALTAAEIAQIHSVEDAIGTSPQSSDDCVNKI